MADVTFDEGKTDIKDAVKAEITSKEVQDFLAGDRNDCADAKCGYDENGGWVRLPDKSIHHEVDKVVAKKYELPKNLRPDIVKPPDDSYYYHVSADGTKKKLLTHDEMLAVIAAQDSSTDIGGV